MRAGLVWASISDCNLTSSAASDLVLPCLRSCLAIWTCWLALFMKSTLGDCEPEERALPMAPPATAPTRRVMAAAAPRRARL